MTTKKQVEKLMRPFLERHPDLVLDSPWLYLKPARHLLRAIILDRTGEATRFRPRWAVMMLFAPVDLIDLAYGEMHSAHEQGSWLWNDPDMPAILFDLLEQKALPMLRSVGDLDTFVTYTSSTDRFPGDPLPAFPHRKVLVDVARGDWESARVICHQWQGVAPRWSDDPRSTVINTIAPLLDARDTPAILRHLHEWEEYTVRQLKLEDIWERTPFPIEPLASYSTS